jgi:hypothetical protein
MMTKGVVRRFPSLTSSFLLQKGGILPPAFARSSPIFETDVDRQECVLSRRLTVLVTHWWEYFTDGQPDEPFIEVLHETGNWLAKQPDVKVISFDDVAQGTVPLS